MTSPTVELLYSGSKGNAALLRYRDTAILIDAGGCERTLTRSLREVGTEPEEIAAVFVTHEHCDHISALDIFIKKHPVPVYIPKGSEVGICRTAGDALRAALIAQSDVFPLRIGSFLISTFPTSHDSGDSRGYRVTALDEAGNAVHTVGYATDLGTVTAEVKSALLGCNTVVLESNYDEDMLWNGPYPVERKRRIASRRGHLSNADTAALAASLAAEGTERFILAHLSENNNLPELALGEVCAALAGFPVTVLAAMQRGIVGFREDF